MTVTALFRRGARRELGGRGIGATLMVAVLLGAQLLTLGCGMVNPAFAAEGAGHHASAASDLAVPHADVGAHSASASGAHASARGDRHLDDHGAPGHHPASDTADHPTSADGAASSHHGADDAPPSHHGDDGGASDCLGTGSCGAVALGVSAAARIAVGPSLESARTHAVERASSVILGLHRPPPKSI